MNRQRVNNNGNTNGRVGGGMGQNGRNGRAGEWNNNTLAEKIRALTFVAKELELYLDTHPTCRVALDYYHRTNDALKDLMEEYHTDHGPLRSEGVTSTDTWTWVDEPWPWHRSDEMMSDDMKNNSWKGEDR